MGQELRYTDTDGQYWSSTLFTGQHAYAIQLNPANGTWNFYGNFRSSGIPIRPVHGEPGIAIERITLDKTDLTLEVGESAALTTTILPENATIQDVTWRSGNDRIATVSPTGVVTAVSSGTTWILAESYDPNRSVQCNVTVTYSVPAAVNLGGKWRMPTNEEWIALTSSANFDWVWDDTQKGYTVTSRISGYEGNSIFLPAAGYRRDITLYSEGDCGLYWTSSLYERDPRYAQGVYFDPSYIIGAYYDTRFSGFSIRPVYGDRPVTTGGDIEGTEEEPWN